jgi:hypothetical protein
MATSIEVRVTGKGSVKDGQRTNDTNTKAHCDLCQQEVDVVASVGQTFACKDCLRQRLEAMTVSSWMLREASGALPWGKVSG